jgi:hypothetical protein
VRLIAGQMNLLAGTLAIVHAIGRFGGDAEPFRFG